MPSPKSSNQSVDASKTKTKKMPTPQLTFVHQSGPKLEEEGLRKVKSHVMVEYVKERKALRGSRPTAPPNGRTNARKNGATSLGLQWRIPKDSSDSDSSDTVTLQPDFLLAPELQPTELLSTAIRDVEGEYDFSAFPLQGEEPYYTFSASQEERMFEQDGYGSIPESVDSLGGLVNLPSVPPKEVKIILQTATSYLQSIKIKDDHLFPVWVSDLSTKIWSDRLKSCEITLLATSLMFSTFLSGTTDVSEAQRLRWTGHVLRLMRTQLAAQDKQIADSTMCGTLLICAHEIGAGQPDIVEAHLKGLCQMVTLRGGFIEPCEGNEDLRPAMFLM
ncbi:hypothetical protein K402DRAFT_217351 [Aulographum hederae CBS 113979]|uniref:Transcription factor domain-containing protein n=1 Tax=Aulographum hederae CBS 113979 TaxID=1176131 RepID=A0A6G1GLV1_9PEZI|nr:hypothetical protein K402DRAFT_217351 [Aulographum hederae CBS 113979]